MPDFSSGDFPVVTRTGKADVASPGSESCGRDVIARTRHAAEDFDAPSYLESFADAIVLLDAGEFSSGLGQCKTHGSHDGRMNEETYIREPGRIPECDLGNFDASFSIDTVVYSQGGSVLVVGWVDDRDAALSSLSIFTEAGLGWNTTDFGRVRRQDAEAALNAPPGHLFGFWVVLNLVGALSTAIPWTVRGLMMNGRYAQVQAPVRLASDADLRTTILSYLAGNQYFGNRNVDSFLSLEGDIGQELIKLNKKITKSILAGARVSYYGPCGKTFKGSIIVCLSGRLDYFFLQSAIFSSGADAAAHEFIFVSNGPELTDALEKEAKVCSRIYGISIVLVCLPDYAGLCAANNIAARYARSKHLLIANPAVFPQDGDWARRHSAIVENASPETTLLFGAPLYYGVGSLMRDGLYLEGRDTGISGRRQAQPGKSHASPASKWLPLRQLKEAYEPGSNALAAGQGPGRPADLTDTHLVAMPLQVEGRVEILSAEFAIGWAAPSETGRFTHLIAVLDNEVIGAMPAKFTRPDLDRQRSEGRLNAYAFVIVFDRPVAAEKVDQIRIFSAYGQQPLRRSNALKIDRSPPLKIFLLGSPRSGTSEMGRTLTSVLKLPWIGEVHAAPLFEDSAKALHGDTKSPMGMLRFLRAQGIGDVAKTALKQGYFYLHGSASFVDKTPGMRMIEATPFVCDCFSDARLIFLSRNPVANVLSRMAKFGGTFENHCLDWTASMTAWMKVRSRLPHFLEIRQEDMMERPAEVGVAIARYIGEPHAGVAIGASLSSGSFERTGAGLGKTFLWETDWSEEQREFFLRVCTPVYDEFIDRDK